MNILLVAVTSTMFMLFPFYTLDDDVRSVVSFTVMHMHIGAGIGAGTILLLNATKYNQWSSVKKMASSLVVVICLAVLWEYHEWRLYVCKCTFLGMNMPVNPIDDLIWDLFTGVSSALVLNAVIFWKEIHNKLVPAPALSRVK